MSNRFAELTQDIQDRIREIAYLMWESAGRQHGMAMQYWLAAEQEVVTTLHAAAERMMPDFGSPQPAETVLRPAAVEAPVKPAAMATGATPAVATGSNAAPLPAADTAAAASKPTTRRTAPRPKAKS